MKELKIEQPDDGFYLLAGSDQQAKAYFDIKGITYDHKRVLHAPRHLKGLRRGLKVIIVGTYYMRPDWNDFREMFVIREWVVKYDIIG